MKTHVSLEQIVVELPEESAEVSSLAREAGLDNAYVERLHNNGLRRVPVSEDRLLSQLLRRSVERLAEAIPDLPLRASGILYAHSLPAFCPVGYPFLEESLPEGPLRSLPRVAVSGQPCSIIHMSIQLATSWLSSVPSGGILLLAGDKVYTPSERIFFGSAMGDSAAAMLVTRSAEHNCVLASVSQCEVLAYNGEKSPSENIQRFRQENPYRIRQAIQQCLLDAELRLENIGYIVPHTPNHLIWDLVAELLPFPRERILTNYLAETGHLNSNDVIAHYDRATRDGQIRGGEIVMLVSPGFGGTRGCTIIRR